MRYYIDMVTSEERIPDPEGDDFADEASAREEAAQSLREFLADRLRAGESIWARWAAQVRDESGEVAFQITTREMMLSTSLGRQILDRSAVTGDGEAAAVATFLRARNNHEEIRQSIRDVRDQLRLLGELTARINSR